MAKSSNSYQAPALEKGLDILEHLSQKATSLSQTEIAEGINRSTNEIYRMLVCLEERGYLIRDEVSGKYRLSLKLYNLSHRHSPVDEIRKVAEYPMQRLSEITNQSCHLGVIYHDQLMVIYQSKSPGPISLSVEEGSLFPLLLTASGRTLLAFMNEQDRNNQLSRIPDFQEYSSKEQQEFIDSLNNIRSQGYYSKPSDVAQGVTDVVVPIGDGSTKVFASLAVSILTTQIDETISFDKIRQSAQDTADQILDKIGINQVQD
ncbi:IclR family transcriptional regulator [Aliifodinibius sp. S!AR15-10]|uniref:IclR family transcriptional regulator n=1 Tax=Aliifodinibius sp. S!AR15-10 TaxID=2950437 RepID=UPI002865464F|nr:IclR family transcriptional regulator [Aliifodinibius sp. S!AR15-10]MDR8391179.1 IclR family transcriptional regulator [Aliifodinibius sp. S!AR15-10]